MKKLSIFLWGLLLALGSYMSYELFCKTPIRPQDLGVIQQQITTITEVQNYSVLITEKAVANYVFATRKLGGSLEKDRIFLRVRFVENIFNKSILMIDSTLQTMRLHNTINSATAQHLQNTLQSSLHQLATKDSILKDFGYELAKTIYIPHKNYQSPFNLLGLSILKTQVVRLKCKSIERLLSIASGPCVFFSHIVATAYSNNLVIKEGENYEAIMLVVEKFTHQNSTDIVNLRMTTANYLVNVDTYEGEGEFIVTDSQITNGDSIKTLIGFVSFCNQYSRDTTITVSMNYKVKQR